MFASLFGTSGIVVLMRFTICVSKSFADFVSLWVCNVEVEGKLFSVVPFLLLSCYK
jgi:hypothetical protein